MEYEEWFLKFKPNLGCCSTISSKIQPKLDTAQIFCRLHHAKPVVSKAVEEILDTNLKAGPIKSFISSWGWCFFKTIVVQFESR